MKKGPNIITRIFGRNVRGVRPRKQSIRIQFFVIIILVISLLALTYHYVDNKMLPVAMAIARMEAKTLSSKIINDAVSNTLKEQNINADELIKYYYNNENEIISCGVNTVLINKICSNIVDRLSVRVHEYDNVIYIPLGNITGESIFTDWGPDIKASVTPCGSVNIDYKRQFESVGINQVNFRVWLEAEITMQIVIPMTREELVVTQEITLVDRVFNGRVPESYVDVPYDSILDVAPEAVE